MSYKVVSKTRSWCFTPGRSLVGIAGTPLQLVLPKTRPKCRILRIAATFAGMLGATVLKIRLGVSPTTHMSLPHSILIIRRHSRHATAIYGNEALFHIGNPRRASIATDGPEDAFGFVNYGQLCRRLSCNLWSLPDRTDTQLYISLSSTC